MIRFQERWWQKELLDMSWHWSVVAFNSIGNSTPHWSTFQLNSIPKWFRFQFKSTPNWFRFQLYSSPNWLKFPWNSIRNWLVVSLYEIIHIKKDTWYPLWCQHFWNDQYLPIHYVCVGDVCTPRSYFSYISATYDERYQIEIVVCAKSKLPISKLSNVFCL